MSLFETTAVKKSTGLPWFAIAKEIITSQKVKFKWGQNDDDIGHTSIVIEFDKTPKFVLGFGGILTGFVQKLNAGLLWTLDMLTTSAQEKQDTREKAGKMRISGSVRIDHYFGRNIKIKGTLLRLSLVSLAEKKLAVEIFETIEKIDMGNFCMVDNNCRSYVVRVAKILNQQPLMRNKDWNMFEQQIDKLIKDDEKKFLEFIRSDRPVTDYIEF